MRITRDTDAALFADYDRYKEYKASTVALRRSFAKRHIRGASKSAEELATFYCEKNGIETSNDTERLMLFSDYLNRSMALMNKAFNVEYISEVFAKFAEANVRKLLSCLEGKSLYDIFGECSGHVILRELYIDYAIQKDGSLCFVFDRTNETAALVLPDYGDSSNINDYDYYRDNLCTLEKGRYLLVATLLLRKYGEVETVMVGGNVRRKLLNSEDYLVNKAPFPITQVDSSWLRTIIRTEGFLVRGHFRNQACGEKYQERRLIYINPFEKHGYVRRAKKIIAEERAFAAA